MKKIILLLILSLTTSGVFHSCSSFLEENPVDRFVVGNFYTDQNGAEAAVAAVYRILMSIYTRNITLLSALPADDEKNGLGMPNQFLQDLEYLRHTSENPFVSSMWQILYQGISRANTAIDIFPEITMDETLKNRLIGELRFLRALFYFNLVSFWGDVPLVTTLESVEDAMGPRTPKDQVYQQIIDDLTFAENNLPVSYPSTEIGRATKGAAKILLGKVYLAMQKYPDCVSKLAEVIDSEASYGYGLHGNYKDNWEKATENGKESVLTIEHMESPGVGNGRMGMEGPKYSLPGGFQVLGINNANEADIPTRDLYSQFLEEDTRRDETLTTDFVSLKDGKVYTSSIPIFVKYWEDGEANVGNCDANFHILRYADALLMYAEALNETGQSAKAHDNLNRVRARAFKSANYNYSGLSQTAFRTAVWQERRLELAMEGHRWFDLVRTGRFVQRMKDHAAYEASVAETNKVEIAQNVKDHMVLMPIPQREMDLNPNLVQNPGW